MRTGYDPKSRLTGVSGVVSVKQADRLELHLPAGSSAGCIVEGDTCDRLPAGSVIEENIFYWQLHPAFRGDHELRFENGGEVLRIPIQIQ